MRIDTFSSPDMGNTYWLHAKQKAIIDLGSHTIAKRLPLDEACCIILTHLHYDHTAALDQLVFSNGAKVMMHEADAKNIGTAASAAHAFSARAPKFHVDTLLKDGDQIDLGDFILRVIHTPGHTPGSICLYDAQSKSLFSGDTVFPFGGIGRTDLLGGSSHDLVQSISRLAKLEVSVLYPGHGVITTDSVDEQIKQSLKFAKANESPE
jgi:glyoxylase-like metal-dependent hydrolase (beta-lactamase superfamily II)